MLQSLQLIFSFVAIIALGLFVLKKFSKGEYISCLNMFSLFLIVDVFLPGVVGALTGQYLKFPYFKSASDVSYFLAITIFVFSVVLFLFGWLIKNSNYKITMGNQYQGLYLISEKMLMCAFWGSVLIKFANLYIEYKACGSFDAFYAFKITRVYLVTIEYQSLFAKAIQFMSEFATTILFISVSIGFVNSKALKYEKFWNYIAPLISLAVCALSLYRGTFLNFGCMMIVSLQYRTDLITTLREKIKSHKRIINIGILSVVMFFLYGAFRTQLNTEQWGESIGFGESLTNTLTNTFGTSLSALIRCIDYLSNGGELFWGKSMYEMFFFFIPRSIWIDKPTHYGIVSLTTAMGSPSTTMDAVTIPGEILLNFGILGIILILPIIGVIFKKFESLKYSERYKYLYAATISTMITTSMWMSFTGFFAQIKYFPIYVLMLSLIIRKDKNNRIRKVSRL